MEGLASLGINLPTLLAQIINFVILFGLLYLVAYKPIIRMLDARSNKIKESMEQTEYIKEQAAKAEQETAKRIAEAGKEGQKMVDRAVKEGEELRRKVQQEAREEIETLIAKAHREIRRERDEVVGEVRQGFAELSILAAEKVIERSLDKKAHRQLIERVLEESSRLKKG